MVVAGEAVHWFDHQRAVPELRRMVRAGGALGVPRLPRPRLRQPPGCDGNLIEERFEKMLEVDSSWAQAESSEKKAVIMWRYV